MKKIIAIVVFMLPVFLMAQSLEGLWKTVDDKTGKAKSIVKIYKSGGKLYGKVIEIIDKEVDVPKCTECKGKLKNKPIEGLQIINGLTKKRGKWKGDDGILDPENGKFYDCKIWLESKRKLNVRGYIGPIFRTQTWYRHTS